MTLNKSFSKNYLFVNSSLHASFFPLVIRIVTNSQLVSSKIYLNKWQKCSRYLSAIIYSIATVQIVLFVISEVSD
jgi:hypothetical protein